MCGFGDLPLCEGTACSSMRVRARVKKEDRSTYHMRIEQRSPSQYLKGLFLYFIPYGAHSLQTSSISEPANNITPGLADLELYGRILFRILFVICPYIDTQLSY